MPRLRYRKPGAGVMDWAQHVGHVSAEAIPDARVMSTIVTPDGDVAVQAVVEDTPVEWFVGSTGQVRDDDELMELAAEAVTDTLDAERARQSEGEERKERMRTHGQA